MKKLYEKSLKELLEEPIRKLLELFIKEHLCKTLKESFKSYHEQLLEELLRKL